MVFKRLFGSVRQDTHRNWALPEGRRVYAIGDIHGRRDLLDALIAMIDADDATRGPAQTRLVFLGDLADRGAESRGVIERLMTLREEGRDVIFIAGNHEELFVKAWECERGIAAVFNRAGGRETLLSYGVSAEEYDAWSGREMIEKVGHIVPRAHIDFLKSFEDWHREGDYLFVHAGIRPGIPVEDQDAEDLRWIRREFTDSRVDHGCMVIHGHTITEDVDVWPNRIGIDTGAYASGKLTAIGLEGEDRWFLQT